GSHRLSRRTLPAQGRHQRAALRLPRPAAQLRAAFVERPLLSEAHRRLRRPPKRLLDANLRQDRDRAAARGGRGRRGGRAVSPRVLFQSFLGPDIERFVAHKRSLGRRFDVEEKTLILLDAYFLEHHIGSLAELTPAVVDEFLRSRPRLRPRSYNHLRCTVGRLFAYLVDRDELPRSPLQSPPRRARYQRTPFIFDVAAARRLLSIAKSLPGRDGTAASGDTYFALFAVLYGLGLRVGEVCRLRLEDLDLERHLLLIRETKFYKSRLVPFGPKLGVLLAR